MAGRDDAVFELGFLLPLNKLKWYAEGCDGMAHPCVLRNRRLVLPKDVSLAGCMTRGLAQ